MTRGLIRQHLYVPVMSSEIEVTRAESFFCLSEASRIKNKSKAKPKQAASCVILEKLKWLSYVPPAPKKRHLVCQSVQMEQVASLSHVARSVFIQVDQARSHSLPKWKKKPAVVWRVAAKEKAPSHLSKLMRPLTDDTRALSQPFSGTKDVSTWFERVMKRDPDYSFCERLHE